MAVHSTDGDDDHRTSATNGETEQKGGEVQDGIAVPGKTRLLAGAFGRRRQWRAVAVEKDGRRARDLGEGKMERVKEGCYVL